MNKAPQDWERDLKQDPFRRKTFTPAKMSAIEQRAAARNSGRTERTRSGMWIVSLASTAIVLIVAVAVVINYQGLIGDDPGPPQPPLPTSTSSPTATPGEPDTDKYVEVDAAEGPLGEKLPFDTEKVQSITLKLGPKEQQRLGSQEQELAIPKQLLHVIPDNLYWTNLAKAAADVQPPLADSGIVIRMHTPSGVYAIPYDVDSNTYELNDRRYYADSQVAYFMHSLLRPGSNLAKVDRLKVQASLEMEQNQ